MGCSTLLAERTSRAGRSCGKDWMRTAPAGVVDHRHLATLERRWASGIMHVDWSRAHSSFDGLVAQFSPAIGARGAAPAPRILRARVSEVAHTKEQTRLPGAAVEGSNSLSCAGSITASDALKFALQDDNNEPECSTARTCPIPFLARRPVCTIHNAQQSWRAPKLHHTFLGARCFDGGISERS